MRFARIGFPGANEAGIDFYKDWLGIPEEHRPPDHYRLLGLEPFEEDGGKIEEAWLGRTKSLRARQLDPRHGAVVQDLLNELAYAETVLTDRQKKRAYDETLRSGVSLDEVDPEARVVVNLAPYVVGGKARARAVAAQAGAGRRMVRIACPQCGHENQKGKLVCRNCGGYLVAVSRRRSRFLGWDVPSWTWPVVAGAAGVAIVIGLILARGFFLGRDRSGLFSRISVVRAWGGTRVPVWKGGGATDEEVKAALPRWANMDMAPERRFVFAEILADATLFEDGHEEVIRRYTIRKGDFRIVDFEGKPLGRTGLGRTKAFSIDGLPEGGFFADQEAMTVHRDVAPERLRLVVVFLLPRGMEAGQLKVKDEDPVSLPDVDLD